MLLDGVVPAEPGRRAAIIGAWAVLVGPGPTLSAAERHAVIRAARAEWAGEPAGGSTLVEEVARRLAFDAPAVDEAMVADLESRGLDRLRYLEIVGVVGRLANIDVYATGLGAGPPALPHAATGGPSGEVAAGVAMTNGLVPSTGPLSALTGLAAFPAESSSFVELHEAFYLPFGEFSNGTYVDLLTRAQIEYVAAHTSKLNECFY